ncbi:MAG: GGDEF domain-containing protein [Burkholderiaceae bacterium]
MVATILVGMLCTHLLCFSVMFFLISRRLHGKKMGMDCFAMGNLLLGLAYALQLAEGGTGFNAMSVINHSLTLASPAAYWIGAMRFFGRSVPMWRPLIAFAVAYAALQMLVQWTLGPVARYAMLAAMAASMFLVMASTVVYGVRTFARDLHGEMVFFALLISGICVLNIIKFIKLVDGGMDALQMDATFHTVFYMYMSFLATVLPPSVVWLVLRRLTEDLRHMAARDPMTQLLNRRGLADALQQHFSTRPSATAYLLMADVDHFKRINDSHGHQTGDSVLCHVAQVLRHTMRRGDLTSRIGGEEFVAICLDTDAHGAMHLAERVRAAIEPQPLQTLGLEQPLYCTVTIGISEGFGSPYALEDAMRQADAALYRGKAFGRNRVEWAQGASGAPPDQGQRATTVFQPRGG